MFYRLTWKIEPEDPDLADTDGCDDVDVPWTMGVQVTKPVPQPIACRLSADEGTKMRDAFLTDIPLFSDRLLEAIRNVGVDNLQTFDARITGEDGQVYTNYKAVNIVGSVKCADLTQSKFLSKPPLPFLKFTHLVIDGKRARGLDLFRLGEDPLVILVSERVKNAIAAINPVGLALEPVEVT